MSTIGITLNNLYEATKRFFKQIEPFQPYVATITIISKAIHKSRFRENTASKIEDLKNQVKLINSIENKEELLPIIESLEYQLSRAETDQLHIRIAFLQLFSLLFSHPGSNFWNSIITLLGRFFSIRHHATHIEEDPSNKLYGILGVISSLGTGVALSKQIGLIQTYNPLCHVLIGASFISMAIESALMVQKFLANSSY